MLSLSLLFINFNARSTDDLYAAVRRAVLSAMQRQGHKLSSGHSGAQRWAQAYVMAYAQRYVLCLAQLCAHKSLSYQLTP